MTPEQRYLFDVTGYLHLENVLTGDTLQETQEAIDRYIKTPEDELPPGFEIRGLHQHGFAFDKCLEALTLHPATWPIVKELTLDKPRFARGSLKREQHTDWQDGERARTNPGGLHCARDDYGWYSTLYKVKDGRIYCDDFVAFFYFTDVYPGDGGLIVIPGSHKSEFQRPEDLLTLDETDGFDPEPDPVFTNITARAGDVIIISELLTHGVLRWRPMNRDRRILVLRYKPQYMGTHNFPQPILDRLSPETRELVESAHFQHTKEIVKQDIVHLS